MAEILNTSEISGVSRDGYGNALVRVRPSGGGALQIGPPTMAMTYEAFDTVRTRLATVTPSNPTALVSASDHQAAESRRTAQIATAPPPAPEG